MLQTRGTHIIDAAGKPKILKGYNLGSWQMLENFMLGYPGVEQELRKNMIVFGGKEKYEYFFDQLANAFIQEKDIKFLKELGCNVIRIPFNYRLFEEDSNPYQYMEVGFKHLDRVVALCKKYSIYVILDMHAVQGYQNADWHCDNGKGDITLYQNEEAKNRFYALWVYIASHYKEEKTIAAYELMNEPVAYGRENIQQLNHIYKECTKKIREVDKKHIIMLEGNFWGRSFEGFEAPFAENLIYSIHYYTEAGLFLRRYPTEEHVENYQRKGFLEYLMDERDSFIKKYKVPCLIGEVGLHESDPNYSEDKKRVLKDQLDIFHDRNYSFTIWSYKDIGNMGLVKIEKDSPWMQFVEKYIKQKKKYHCDFGPLAGDTWELADRIRSYYIDDFSYCFQELEENINLAISKEFTKVIGIAFAKELAIKTKEEINTLVASFAFDNCSVREDWKKIIENAFK